ncbi:hypothetical protein, partial [Haloferula sp.]|uniref:hypothetical protein n=1 Tax=Haloferula sp. TaxID=2497595 RepID=UPI003C785117
MNAIVKMPTRTSSRSHSRRLGLSAALTLCTLCALPAGATSMSFEADRDALLIAGNNADNKFGAATTFGAGSLSHSSGIWEENSVLSFDVSALSGLYSSIDSITLR